MATAPRSKIMSFRETLQSQHAARKNDGLWRSVRTLESQQGVDVKVEGRSLINFSSNDYLGLASAPEMKLAATEAVEKWGVGAAASHLVCGHQSPHALLEQDVADFVGAAAAIVFSTGYMANLAVPAAFLDRHDLLLQDKLNHASLIDAGQLCRANSRRYRHLDVNHAAELLANETRKTMLSTDGVFSMNGSVAPLADLNQLINRGVSDNRMLLVDDAHGFGVLGKNGAGSLSHFEMKPTGNVLLVGTLSKAIGAFGAFVAGDRIWIEHLIQYARPFIYTTALPPSIVAAARCGVRLVREQSWRREKLTQNIATLQKLAEEFGIELLPSETPIQSVVFGSPQKATLASHGLQAAGFLVIAIRPPTVPEGTSRLRITLSAEHDETHIASLVRALAECIA